MIVIYINGEGTAEKLSPQHVYQGSNQTGVMVFAPVPNSTSMGIAFRLPDGTSTPYYAMTPLQSVEGLMQYEFTLPTSITQKAGEMAIALQATFTDGQQTSQLVTVEIEKSVLPVLPDEPTPDVYDILRQRISANEADISTLQGQIGHIEELSESAEKASQNAVETANEAKTTADGLADSIARANETADSAKSIAEDASAVANDAKTMAQNASNSASQAVSTANSADYTAVRADANALNAYNKAESAQVQAGQASSKANDAEFKATDALEKAIVARENSTNAVTMSQKTATQVSEFKESVTQEITEFETGVNGKLDEFEKQLSDTGTIVKVVGVSQKEVDFKSDPQGQLNELQDSKVNKAGDTMTGTLKAPSFQQSDTSKEYVDLVDGNGNNFGVGGIAGNIYRLQNLASKDELPAKKYQHNLLIVQDAYKSSLSMQLINDVATPYEDANDVYRSLIGRGIVPINYVLGSASSKIINYTSMKYKTEHSFGVVLEAYGVESTFDASNSKFTHTLVLDGVINGIGAVVVADNVIEI